MSNSIVVGPLPNYINILKVREVFSPFVTDKIILKDAKAYIRFTDPNDIESLDMRYPTLSIPELGNAPIDIIPENFNWSLIDPEHEGPKQELTTQDFIMNQKKQEPKPVHLNSKFIVVSECDKKCLDAASDNEIRTKLLSKYKIGRIIKYKTSLYIEFEDQNEVETLQLSFPGLHMKELGQKATIGLADENFNYNLVKAEVQKYEKEQKAEQQQREQKLRQEQEKEIERKKKEKIEMEKMQRQALEKKLREEAEKQKQSQWSVRPDGPRESVQPKSKEVSLEVFWAIVVGIWAVYVMFM